MNFTAHNIKFPNGTFTMNPQQEEFKDSFLCSNVLRTIKALGKENCNILDLGCLEGGYSLALAEAGHSVIGIEARENNYQNCVKVEDAFKYPRLKFIKGDVKDISILKECDIALCCGILYHLDNPVSFLKTLGSISNMIVVDTHYSEEQMSDHKFVLSEMCDNEGKRGRWFTEHDDNISPEGLEQNNWSSYSNHKSFWLEKGELMNSIREAGFNIVFQQCVFAHPNPVAYNQYRGLFIGIKG